MANINNTPKQLTLPFDSENSLTTGEIISFLARKEKILAAQALTLPATELSESEILKRVLERADRLAWYK